MPGVPPVNPSPEQQWAVSYPTPQMVSRHLTERVSVDLIKNQAVPQPYSPHPNQRLWAGYFFVYQTPIDPADPNWVLRYWVNGRNAQNTYNFATSYDEDANSKPVFVREFLLDRTTYTPQTKLTALQGMYKITVTNGGSGYNVGSTVVNFAGGTGSGGVAIPIIENGVITHVLVTTSGTYTVAPTVSFTDSGTTPGAGAAATAFVQPQTALLIEEEQDRTGAELDTVYVKVRRKWLTLPGGLVVTKKARTDETYEFTTIQKVLPDANPNTGIATISSEIVGQSTTWAIEKTTYVGDGDGNPVANSLDTLEVYDRRLDELGRTQIITWRYIAAFDADIPPANYIFGTSVRLPAGQDLGSVSPANWEVATAYVIKSWAQLIDGGENKYIYVRGRPLPNTWDEEVEMHFQFPAIFTFSAGLLTGYQGNHAPPFALSDFTLANGFVAYNLTAHRTLSKRGLRRHMYNLGPSGVANVEFRVVTTASASRVFGSYIGDNTAHPGFTMTDIYTDPTTLVLTTQTIEEYQYSQIHGRVGKTPDEAYATTDVLVIRDAEEFIDQSLFCERVIDYISESTPISSFPV